MSRDDWVMLAFVVAVGLIGVLILTLAATAGGAPACGGSPLAARCGTGL